MRTKFAKILSDSAKCNFYDPKTIEYFVPLHEIFIIFQVESDGIFVNLKPTTEGKDAMNIKCNHNDN